MIRESLDPEAEIIFGTTINEDLTDQVVVTVIATGLEDEEEVVQQPQPAQQQQQTQSANLFNRRMQSQQRMTPQPVQQPVQQPQQQPIREGKPKGFDNLDEFESEIKIPDFLTRKRF